MCEIEFGKTPQFCDTLSRQQWWNRQICKLKHGNGSSSAQELHTILEAQDELISYESAFEPGQVISIGDRIFTVIGEE